ncbi:MAG TPA: hypothetical protein VK430_02470 [Xanthobacteraceae bacterium]|nr:hypothetical protein [Xanthobacteraceae bacterium]
MMKRSIIAALLACLVCSPVQAKTFIGVLWPMFGPLPAIGLVELVAELKMMPDVEVTTYLHQSWPALVKDLDHLPDGTRSMVIGYSLGANASAWVANKAKHVDLIIALQPSMLSWNPDIVGDHASRIIEIYNPDPAETFGGMGSKKLVGPNIEYIANHDSHMGAQFSWQFRDLVKTEVAKMSREDREEIAQAEKAAPVKPPAAEPVEALAYSEPASPHEALTSAKPGERNRKAAQVPPPRQEPSKVASAAAPPAKSPAEPATAGVPEPTAPSEAKTEAVAKAAPTPQAGDLTAFLERLTRSVDSGQLPLGPGLTPDSLMAYAKRTYHVNPDASASCLPACSHEQL